MKIAIIITSLANKGPVLVVKDLCCELLDKGYVCKVFYFDNIIELEMPCEVERISFFGKFDFDKWDIVHCHMLRPDIWGFVNRVFRLNFKPKMITTIHQNIKETLVYDYGFIIGNLVSIIWNSILFCFDGIVVLTSEHKKVFNKMINDKISIVYNGRDVDYSLRADEDDLELIESLKKKYIVLGTTSIVTKRKGIEQIVKALVHLPNYAYVIVGDGPEVAYLQELSKRLNVDKRCFWLGTKLNGYRYTQYFDIYLIMSRSEGFPLSLIEAAALSKPTICSNIPIFRSIVDEKSVCFANLDDTIDLVNAIKVISNDRTIGSNLNSFYKKELTKEIMCNNYITVYNK